MSQLTDLVTRLQAADDAERLYAAEDLGYLNTPEAVPALVARMGAEPSLAVRDAILQALVRIEGDAAIEGAVRLLDSEEPRIRNQAVEVLRRKGASAIPFLRPVMQGSDKDKRKLVLDVLSGLSTPDAADIYAAALTDRDSNVVITGVENLGRIRAVAFRPQIEDLLVSAAHPMLLAACVEALVGMGEAAALAAIRRRFPAWATVPDFLLPSCLKAMAALGSAREFEEVARLLPGRGPHLRAAILGALRALATRGTALDPEGTLLPMLRVVVEGGDAPLCRYQAVRVLGGLTATHAVVAFLVACLASPERLVRLGAIESLREAAAPGVQAVLARHATTETDEEIRQALAC
jgi:HEAT repeat protein